MNNLYVVFMPGIFLCIMFIIILLNITVLFAFEVFSGGFVVRSL